MKNARNFIGIAVFVIIAVFALVIFFGPMLGHHKSNDIVSTDSWDITLSNQTYDAANGLVSIQIKAVNKSNSTRSIAAQNFYIKTSKADYISGEITSFATYVEPNGTATGTIVFQANLLEDKNFTIAYTSSPIAINNNFSAYWDLSV